MVSAFDGSAVIRSVLVVCVGNICRSPVGARLLQSHWPDLQITSAGLGALVGHPADEVASEVAALRGVSLAGHVARQFSTSLGSTQDLILTMEPGHRREIGRMAPQLLGRTLLFDRWTGAQGIADPYQKSKEQHEIIFNLIAEAADAWAKRLGTL